MALGRPPGLMLCRVAEPLTFEKLIISIGSMSEVNETAPPLRLDSELLRTLLAIAETGSFTKAATRILRTQSATSLQVKRLEQIVEQALFQRQRGGVVLTPAGETLRPIAQQVVRLLDQAMAELKPTRLEGLLRIAIPDEFGRTLLPSVLSRFAAEHPKVQLQVRCALSASFPGDLERGELDIAVYDSEVMRPGATLLGQQKRCWVRSRHHLVQERDPVPIALFDRSCWWRDHAVKVLGEAGTRFQVVYTSESVAGIVAAVESGVAVGLLGLDSLRDDFVELAEAEGFPAMPVSLLLLDRRSGIDAALADTMSEAIRAAFRGSAAY